MIGFFPTIYDDELAYSVFARYYAQTGHLNYTAAAQDLFVGKVVMPNPEFYPALTDDVHCLIEKQMSFEMFAEKHTMFSQYTRYLPLERRKKAFDLLITMDRRFYDSLYVRTKADRKKAMCYCPLCAAEDRGKYGETYWHRQHQLIGVEVCIRHRCRLENSSIGLTVESQRFMLANAESAVPYDSVANYQVSEVEMELAEYMVQVFNAPIDMKNETMIGEFLHCHLGGTPYTSPRGEKVMVKRLYLDMKEYYVGLINQIINDWWYVQKVFCNQNFYFADVGLIAFFLKISAEELILMQEPEVPLHIKFDSTVFNLHKEGRTYKQIAEIMGVSLNTIKMIGERRYKSTKEIISE